MVDAGTSHVELSGDTLVLVLRGYQTGPTIRAAVEKMTAALVGKKVRFVYFAVDEINAFHPNVAGPGNELLALVKKHGVELAIASSTNAGVRMMGQTLAFAVGMKMRFVSTRAEAFQRIEEMRKT